MHVHTVLLPFPAVFHSKFQASIEVGIEDVAIAAGQGERGILAHAQVAGFRRLGKPDRPVDAVAGGPDLCDAQSGVVGPDIVARRVPGSGLAGRQVEAKR